MEIKLSEQVSPAFKTIYDSIKARKYSDYVLKGGRGSTKSSFVSKITPLLLMSNKNYNMVVLRKVANTLRGSVFNQMLWGIEELGIMHLFKATFSPLKITYLPTGQEIVFLGCDDPTKIKSFKFKNGYAAIIWFEELDQFDGMEEVRNIKQSLMRGGTDFWCFMSYNPPKSKNNWVNEEMEEEKPDRLVHHSTYLDVPEDWLGPIFIKEAEDLKTRKPMAYEHEYMGTATGTGGGVFDNVTIRTITDEEISQMDRFYYGCDFGFTIDPAAFGKYYVHNNKLWILDEIYQTHLSNKELAEKIKNKGVQNDPVVFDCAEPKSIAEIRTLGVHGLPCKKGPDSINFGMKYLQSLDEIIIDRRRTPNAAKEFVGYEYEMNKDGKFISRYPDKDNHFIDATRYGLERFIQSHKQIKHG